MKITDTQFEGVLRVERNSYPDERGLFSETFSKSFLGKIDFIQDCYSVSKRGVIRGLHYQIDPFAQTKYVYVLEGAIQDVVMDLRRNSPTYGKYIDYVLSSENNLGLFIPEGFAHGFQALSEKAIVCYKIAGEFKNEYAKGIHYSEVDWKIKTNITVSEKDQKLPKL
jgi:dTDP-4-dehydrorhamnose 3,5-epimerase